MKVNITIIVIVLGVVFLYIIYKNTPAGFFQTIGNKLNLW